MRIRNHPIIGKIKRGPKMRFFFNGKKVVAYGGETIATALHAAGIKVLRRTEKLNSPRGIYCAIGQCTDCMMVVDGLPNVRTCITTVRDGMKVEIQQGRGIWEKDEKN